jgi:hypothetical protein
VALGTFSVEYHSANVLFDTRATHYFVTASWVESHSILVAPMYPPLRVSSIGGRTQTDRFFPSARVQIRLCLGTLALTPIHMCGGGLGCKLV